MHGALWDLTPAYEADVDAETVLNVYEGSAYRTMNIEVVHDILGKLEAFTYYLVNRFPQSPPGRAYRALIAEGYRDFSIPRSQLCQAVLEAERKDREFLGDACDEPWRYDFERRR